MYEPFSSLAALDQNKLPIMLSLFIVVAAVGVYWVQAWRIAKRDEVYVVPFIAIALFFWHDLSFVLLYDKWFNVYNHWWLKMWWYAEVPSVIFECIFIYHVIKWGRKDFFSNFTQTTFTVLVILGVLGIGAYWYLVKTTMQDELFFITFVITAVCSVPFHTGLMAKRQSRKGQSVLMELSTIVMLVFLTYAFSHVSDFFTSPLYLTFVAVMIIWPLVNVWLFYQLPEDNLNQKEVL